MGPDPSVVVAAILNDAWMVRHYWRDKLRRRQAILKLGLTVREAFNTCDDYEVLLTAVVDGLRPHDRPPF
jgi:hypothetical protein